MTDIRAAVNLIEALGASILEWPDDDLGGHALAYAHNGWPVLPLRDKAPRTAHGSDDATTDLNAVAGWWEQWPTANIGLRVPSGVVVIDIDPRNGGEASWATLHERHAEVATRTAVSGRGDGGRHLYYLHPGGKLAAKLGAGVDVKATGYVVAPPSLHPLTGGPYRWVHVTAPIAAMPAHLVKLACPVVPKGIKTTTRTYVGDSIADWYSTTATWPQILEPHGWQIVRGDGDADRSVWRHPTADSATSATVRHGCLFVYSTNTPFEPTDATETNGYTRFRAFAILEHRSDLSAAAGAARAIRGAA